MFSALRFIPLLLLMLVPLTSSAAKPSAVTWQTWSEEAFAQAQKQNKLVLLNMEAVWCHWCHVMDDKTYANEDVGAYLDDHFVALRVDSDSRPDLANRYRAWGWPATIILLPDGTELVKRAGYQAAEPFLRLLKAVVADPTPEAAALIPSITPASESAFSEEILETLMQRHIDTYDWSAGGLRGQIKYVDGNKLEWSLYQALLDPYGEEANQAKQTLDVGLNLFDEFWGGVYQYSTGRDWFTPHHEKLLKIQARYMRLYAQGYQQFSEPSYLEAAESIAQYVSDFLTSNKGVFYTSQDADLVPGQDSRDYFEMDDRERRDKGIPRIDTHIYTSDNAQMAEAYAVLYRYGENAHYLKRATTAMDWLVSQRQKANGAFTRESAAQANMWLADSLYAAKALLTLHLVTGEKRWLDHAIKAADYIDKHHRAENGGFIASKKAGRLTPFPDIDENIDAARFFNLLSHYSGNSKHRQAAEHAVLFLASKDVAMQRIEETGLLLLNDEMTRDPAHFTVVASRSDKVGKALFASAIAQPGTYQRIEWWDRSKGPLTNPDISYPKLKKAAGFICQDGRCSLPSLDAPTYLRRISSLQD